MNIHTPGTSGAILLQSDRSHHRLEAVIFTILGFLGLCFLLRLFLVPDPLWHPDYIYVRAWNSDVFPANRLLLLVAFIALGLSVLKWLDAAHRAHFQLPWLFFWGLGFHLFILTTNNE